MAPVRTAGVCAVLASGSTRAQLGPGAPWGAKILTTIVPAGTCGAALTVAAAATATAASAAPSKRRYQPCLISLRVSRAVGSGRIGAGHRVLRGLLRRTPRLRG